MDSIYKAFEENPNITEEDIKRIYLKLVKKYHPDLHRDNTEKYTKMTRNLNTQYSEIKRRIRLRNEKKTQYKEADVKNNNTDHFEKTNVNRQPTSSDNVKKAEFRNATFSNKYTTSKYKRESSNSSHADILRDCSDNYMVISNNSNSYLLISKDYGVKKFKDEKIEKRKIMYIEMNDKKHPIYLYDIYGDIDLKKIETDESYRKYIVNDLLTKDKLNAVSEKLYGYIGSTIQKGNEYEQQCNVNILQSLKEKMESEKLYFKRKDNSIFSLKKLYEEFTDAKKLDVYAYENYGANKEIAYRSLIKTDVNMDRLAVNKRYKEMVFEKYFKDEWIRTCSDRNNGYIGNPEEEYKKTKESGMER